MKKKEPKPITIDEIFREMEKCRKTARNMELTPVQIDFIKRARTGQRIVSFGDLARLWERAGWGKVNDAWLWNQYKRLKDAGEI